MKLVKIHTSFFLEKIVSFVALAGGLKSKLYQISNLFVLKFKKRNLASTLFEFQQ
jgi:hypothetical protein